jgi:hypothetical protein
VEDRKGTVAALGGRSRYGERGQAMWKCGHQFNPEILSTAEMSQVSNRDEGFGNLESVFEFGLAMPRISRTRFQEIASLKRLVKPTAPPTTYLQGQRRFPPEG